MENAFTVPLPLPPTTSTRLPREVRRLFPAPSPPPVFHILMPAPIPLVSPLLRPLFALSPPVLPPHLLLLEPRENRLEQGLKFQ